MEWSIRVEVVLIGAVLSFVGCGQGSTAGNGDCACDKGQVCVDGSCVRPCTNDSHCDPGDTCSSGGTCVPGAGECTSAADCRSPAPCEDGATAVCSGGACSFEPYACVQAAPIDPCLEQRGTCDANLGGACQQESCCVYLPVWPTTSGAPAPACPFAGEDPNGNGAWDTGEAWSGTCDHGGACVGCLSIAQCDDGNPCTIDDCPAGTCIYDVESKVGVACAIAQPGDGVCVADGGGVVCRLAAGGSCTSGDACASGICGCADDGCTTQVCQETVCDTCSYNPAGSGPCTAASPGLQAEGCNDAGQACNASGDCVTGNGGTCSAHAECGSGFCECADVDCTSRVCSEVSCLCSYNADGDASCEAALTDGTADPEDCSGTCHAGACRHALGEVCTFDSDCLSDFCTDGVCCDAAACSGDCAACNRPGSEGTCAGSDAACAGNCGYCAAGGGGAFSCTCDLAGGAHSHVECAATGGQTVSAGGVSFCRFDVPLCPAGWAQHGGWSTTVAQSAAYVNEVSTGTLTSGGCCGYGAGCETTTATCSSAAHGWSNNAALESRTCTGTNATYATGSRGSCDNGGCSGPVTACSGATQVTVTAVRTRVGCK